MIKRFSIFAALAAVAHAADCGDKGKTFDVSDADNKKRQEDVAKACGDSDEKKDEDGCRELQISKPGQKESCDCQARCTEVEMCAHWVWIKSGDETQCSLVSSYDGLDSSKKKDQEVPDGMSFFTGDSGLKWWMILLIVIGVLAFFGIIAGVFMMMQKKKKAGEAHKADEEAPAAKA